MAPDPMNGIKYPIGGVIFEENMITMVKTEIPDLYWKLAGKRIQSRLGSITNQDQLPDVFGPYCILSGVEAIPPEAKDNPYAWVESRLNSINRKLNEEE